MAPAGFAQSRRRCVITSAGTGKRPLPRRLPMPVSRRVFALALVSLPIAPLAWAAEHATPDEAKALAEKAAAHLKEVGLPKAIADFNDPAGGYIDRELFVNIYGPDGKLLCGWGVPALVGRDATTFKDVTGKEFGKAIIETAKTQGSGWVEYRMTDPLTKKIEPKKSWVIQVGDYVVFAGAFAS
jgi:hypothetical protein